MSKPVRLREHLYAELEKLATRENRSLTNLVNHLLEQVLEMTARTGAGVAGVGQSGKQTPQVEPPAPVQADSQSRDVAARTITSSDTGTFKPDFKPEKGKKK